MHPLMQAAIHVDVRLHMQASRASTSVRRHMVLRTYQNFGVLHIPTLQHVACCTPGMPIPHDHAKDWDGVWTDNAHLHAGP